MMMFKTTTYLYNVLMIEFGGLVLEDRAASHLETEESAHWLLGSVRLLLALLLLLWDNWSCGGYWSCLGCCLLALLYN
jgi:hypothetical protein